MPPGVVQDRDAPAVPQQRRRHVHGRFAKDAASPTLPGYGLGIAFNDYDRDGWPDILVANDNIPEQLFHNLGNGKFEEVALKLGLAYDEDGHTFSGMGVDFSRTTTTTAGPTSSSATLANEKYALFRNRKGTFEYVTAPSGRGRNQHRATRAGA